MGNQRLSTVAARAYAIFVVVPFVFLPLLPRAFNAVFVTVLGIALGGALCVLGVLARPQRLVPRSVTLALGGALASAVWFSLSSLWAGNPRFALYSPRAAAVWVLFALWLVAGALVADSRSLRETTMSVAAAGVFIAGAAIFEALTVGYQRSQGYAAGFLENSTSSGILLAVALLACLVGLSISRSALARSAYSAAAVICSIALVMSSSRDAWLGLLAMSVFAVAVARLGVPRSRLWVFPATSVALGLLVTVLGVTTAVGVLGTGALRVLAQLGTDRDAIWRSAWAQFIRTPVIGEGVGQFSAVIQSGIGGVPTATYDTHNVLIGAALGGGVIGLTLVLVTFYTVSNATVIAVQSSKRSLGAVLLASLPVFLLATALFAWVDSAALLVLSALLGAFLGSYLRSPAAGTGEPAPKAVMLQGAGLLGAVLAVVVTLVSFGPVTMLYNYGRIDFAKNPPSLDEALALHKRLPEGRVSLLLLSVLKYQLLTGSVDAQNRAHDVLELVKPDAAVDVTVATKAIAQAEALGDRTNPAGFPLVEELALAGTKADPASGLWYTLVAYDAQRRGLRETAAKYAKRALEFPQDATTRANLEAIAGS